MPSRVDHSRIHYPSQKLTLDDLHRVDPISYSILCNEYSHEQSRAAEQTPLPFKRLLVHERGLADGLALQITENIGATSKLKDRLLEMYVQWGLAASKTYAWKLAWDIEKQVEVQLGKSLNEDLHLTRKPSPPARGR